MLKQENPNPQVTVSMKLRKQQVDVLKLLAKQNFMSFSSYVRKTLFESLIKSHKIKKADIEKIIDW